MRTPKMPIGQAVNPLLKGKREYGFEEKVKAVERQYGEEKISEKSYQEVPFNIDNYDNFDNFESAFNELKTALDSVQNLLKGKSIEQIRSLIESGQIDLDPSSNNSLLNTYKRANTALNNTGIPYLAGNSFPAIKKHLIGELQRIIRENKIPEDSNLRGKLGAGLQNTIQKIKGFNLIGDLKSEINEIIIGNEANNKIKQELKEIVFELELTERMYKSDPVFEKLLEQLIPNSAERTELIKQFEMSWRSSVLLEDESDPNNSEEQTEEYKNIRANSASNARFLPRSLKKPFDIAILLLLIEFKNWELKPEPLVILLPKIQFIQVNSESSDTHRSIISMPIDNYDGFTISPGGMRDTIYFPKPYSHMGLKLESKDPGFKSGASGTLEFFQAGDAYALYKKSEINKIQSNRKKILDFFRDAITLITKLEFLINDTKTETTPFFDFIEKIKSIKLEALRLPKISDI